MPIIQDIWRQEFSILLISSDSSSADWLKVRLGKLARSWTINTISRFGETLPMPLEKYSLAIIDSNNSVNDILAIYAQMREFSPELPVILLVSR